MADAYSLSNGSVAPFDLSYKMIVRNKDTEYILAIEEDVKITRNMDCVPSKMTFKVVKDEILDITEGNAVAFYVNEVPVFKGFIFSKARDKNNIITVTCYDQLRYFKNKDCYYYTDKTATEVLKMIADDFKLTLGDVANTEFKIKKRIERDKTLTDIMNTALYLTHINTHKLYQVYDEAGKIVLASDESMKLDLYIDTETFDDYTCESSIDKDTYNYIKVVRNVPDGKNKKLQITGVVADEDHVKEWGRLQQLYIPEDKVTNAIDMAVNMIKEKNRKTRDVRLKNVLGDVRVRGGSIVYLKHNFGDINVDSYVMVESVTHSFKNGIHIMDLDLRYNAPIGNYQIIQNSDAEAVAKIQSKQKTKNGGQTLGGVPTGATGTSAQVDTAFAMNQGRVSPYGSVGCADTVTSAGSYYNSDLSEEYKKGTVSVPVLRSNLENKGYVTENYNGYANKGDLLIYGDNDHVVISDGSGGCFGNSSSAGYARSYSDVNYAYGDGEPPTKIVRMGVN